MNMIGVVSEPFVVKGRKRIVNVRVIRDWNDLLHRNVIRLAPSQICLFVCFNDLRLCW